ncbi:MAG: type 4a pilus biogenesis protein PilO [Moraxella sp.]|nr:type 4a pilus biogenesis protein PilO [Moraxella sp.]
MKFSLKKPKQTQEDVQQNDESLEIPKPKSPLAGLLSKSKGGAGSSRAKARVRNKKLAPKKKKEAFNFKKFWAEVNSLNAQNYGSAPLTVKIFLLTMLFALILVGAWFALLSPKLDEIKSAEAHQVSLLSTYQEKESKARHLDEYTRQVQQMRVDFAELLNQLPKDTRVPELVDGINMVGSGSGIKFQDISVQSEIEQEFFIEQPIQIIGIGNYHQFGSFVSGIAALPRIITMHDFEVKNQQPTLDRMPELQLVLQTKTYRAKDVDLNAPAQANNQATENQ